jgi:uncharacterized integral membrane protein
MKLWLALFLALLILVVIAQNTEVVTMKFLFWEASLSRVVLLLLTLIVGFVVGFVVAKMPRRKKGAAPPPA